MGLARKDLKGPECKGGKKAKQRVTVALIANAAGGKEAAIVVWKSAKPRCFKGIHPSSLPVQYYSQPKAWMTGAILESVLSKLNRRLSAKGQKLHFSWILLGAIQRILKTVLAISESYFFLRIQHLCCNL